MCPKKMTSVPTWTVRRKGTNGKFPSSESGFASIHEALVAIKGLEACPGILLPGEQEILTAAHLILEVTTNVSLMPGVSQYHGAVSFDILKDGIRRGIYPRITSIIPPVFGYYGADQGGLISQNPLARIFAADLLEEAVLRNLELKLEGLGEGITIVWPAYMSISALECASTYCINNEILMRSAQWERFREGVVDVLKKVKDSKGEEAAIHLEWKVNDPGLIDIIPTLHLAIEMAHQINETLGWKGVWLNNELAHAGLAGLPFTECVARTFHAGLFDRIVHVNSGTIHTEDLEKWLVGAPFHPADWPGIMDQDWPVGFGSAKLLKQQQDTIGLLAEYAARTGEYVILEHDVFHSPAIVPLGSNYGEAGNIRQPFDVLVASVLAANKMWQTALNNLPQKNPE